jgi:hypothetical protein
MWICSGTFGSPRVSGQRNTETGTCPRVFSDERASTIHYKPVAIYYGRHMNGVDKRKLHEVAKDKGIKEYEMYLDYSSLKYEMLYREYIE